MCYGSGMRFRLSLLLTALSLSSCVYGPATPNVRIVNLVAENVRVETVEDGVKKVQVISTGATALDYAPAATVYGPNATTRVAAEPASSIESGRYACRHERSLGRNELVVDVMIDEEGNAWAKAPNGRRVAYPAQVTPRCAASGSAQE